MRGTDVKSVAVSGGFDPLHIGHLEMRWGFRQEDPKLQHIGRECTCPRN